MLKPYQTAAWLLVLLGITVPASAAPAKSKSPPGVDPKADVALRTMGETLAQAGQLSFQATDTVDHILPNGQKIQLSKTVTVAARRPDKVTAVAIGDVEDLHYFYDSKSLTLINIKDNVHATASMPPTIDAMFDELAERYGIVAPVSDLLFSKPYDELISRVRSGMHLGMHNVNGVKCHHLAFRQEAVDWQIWIEDSKEALPRKIVITYKESPGHPQYMVLLDKWDLATELSDSAFVGEIPKGSKEVKLEPLADLPASTTPEVPAKNPFKPVPSKGTGK